MEPQPRHIPARDRGGTRGGHRPRRHRRPSERSGESRPPTRQSDRPPIHPARGAAAALSHGNHPRRSRNNSRGSRLRPSPAGTSTGSRPVRQRRAHRHRRRRATAPQRRAVRRGRPRLPAHSPQRGELPARRSACPGRNPPRCPTRTTRSDGSRRSPGVRPVDRYSASTHQTASHNPRGGEQVRVAPNAGSVTPFGTLMTLGQRRRVARRAGGAGGRGSREDRHVVGSGHGPTVPVRRSGVGPSDLRRILFGSRASSDGVGARSLEPTAVGCPSVGLGPGVGPCRRGGR